MANLFQQLKEWLTQQPVLQRIWQEPDEDEATEPEANLTELPPELAQRLITLIEQLPSHPADQEAIQTCLESALAEWQQQPETYANSLVILSSPVSAVSRILSESLAESASVQSWPLSILEWRERPIQPEEIANKLRHQLGRGALAGAAAEPAIAVIPNLSWCFLRSAEGLGGIDYLRDHLLNDRTQFWVIGSDQVGWEYLKSVLELRAYCGQVITLPQLSAEQLEDWMMPVAEALEIHFDSPSIRDRLQNLSSSEKTSDNDSEQADSPHRFKAEYFRRLADISEGISTVALKLFLHSVEAEPLEAEETQDSEDSEEPNSVADSKNMDSEDADPDPDPPLRLVARAPKLPQLPTLDQNDHYLLYSLLLHGDLTLTALAESLGDTPQTVNNRVQLLRRAGLLQQQQDVIRVNPAHYPRLQRELAANNFLIEHSE